MNLLVSLFWLIVVLFFIILAFLAYKKGLYPKPIQGAINVVSFYPQLLLLKLKYQCGLKQEPWNWMDDTVLMGQMPIEQHVQKLSNMGVRYAVNLCYIYNIEQIYSKYGIEQLWLPTLDHYEPSLQDINSGVDLIQKARAEGAKVYVHCKGGHGRSAAG